MTEDDLQAIEARANAATPGPWRQAMCSLSCVKPEHAGNHPGPPDCVYDRVNWTNSPNYVTAENGTELCSPDDYGDEPKAEDTAFIASATCNLRKGWKSA
jgi:hypothetical protein